jgi:hypothetical protein
MGTAVHNEQRECKFLCPYIYVNKVHGEWREHDLIFYSLNPLDILAQTLPSIALYPRLYNGASSLTCNKESTLFGSIYKQWIVSLCVVAYMILTSDCLSISAFIFTACPKGQKSESSSGRKVKAGNNWQS